MRSDSLQTSRIGALGRASVLGIFAALLAAPASADETATTLGAFFQAAGGWSSELLVEASLLAGTLAFIEITSTFLFSFFSRSTEVLFSFRLLAYKLIPLALVMGILQAFWGVGELRLLWLMEWFMSLGRAANGGVDLEPTLFLLQGLSLGNQTMVASFGSGISLFEIGPAVFFQLLIWAAIAISYLVIAVTMAINIVGFYLLLGTGPVWVACGASRWSAGITEKYIGLLLQFAIRVFLLLLLAGVIGGVAPAFSALVNASVTDGSWGIEVGATIAMVSVLLSVVVMWLPAYASKELAGGLHLGLREALAGGRVQE